MNQSIIINQVEEFVKNTLKDAEGGHDWWHIHRVRSLAIRIAATEQVDIFIVELGALLHDIADSKFHGGDELVGPKKAREFLESLAVENHIIEHIEQIIRHISFKGGNEKQAFRSSELDVIQDADRLDAMGAIGIARAFNYGGFKNRPLYDPSIPPDLNMDRETYKKSTAPSLNHFYEKLLQLKERMNTPTGKMMAVHRHCFMENYLEEFFKEWEGLL